MLGFSHCWYYHTSNIMATWVFNVRLTTSLHQVYYKYSVVFNDIVERGEVGTLQTLKVYTHCQSRKTERRSPSYKRRRTCKGSLIEARHGGRKTPLQ